MRQPIVRDARTTAWSLALAAALLAIAPLQGMPNLASAGEIKIGKDGIMINQSENKARASASASASAKASAGGGGNGCQASSSSSAEAQAGDQHAVDHDEDFASSDDGACNARAQSSASANATGPSKND